MLKRSRDGGATWSPLAVVGDSGPHTFGNPCPVLDTRTGTLVLLATQNLGTDREKEIIAGTSYEAANGRVEVRDFIIAARDVGTLSFSFNIDGLTQDRMQALDYSQARLIGAALGWADASLYRRFVAMQAAQSRTPEAQLREQFAAMVEGALGQPDAVALAPVREALLRFIRGQASAVDIRVNPPRPIGAEEMQQVPPSPAELQRVLGITATAR